MSVLHTNVKQNYCQLLNNLIFLLIFIVTNTMYNFGVYTIETGIIRNMGIIWNFACIWDRTDDKGWVKYYPRVAEYVSLDQVSPRRLKLIINEFMNIECGN